MTAIATLLSDRDLREQFRNSPQAIAEHLGLAGAELELVARLDPAGLEQQAETLLNKRWHEVQKLLPMTLSSLGSEAAELYRFYAQQQWPQGHRRHLLDAAGFIAFLELNQLGVVNRNEKRWVRGYVS